MLDRSQIEQVLINLLKNAGEACVEQIYPEVIISTHCDLENIYFSFLSVIMVVAFFQKYWIKSLFLFYNEANR